MILGKYMRLSVPEGKNKEILSLEFSPSKMKIQSSQVSKSGPFQKRNEVGTLNRNGGQKIARSSWLDC